MGASAAAVAAEIVQATKASGVVIKMDPGEFQKIVAKTGKCLIVCATGGIISTNYQYLTSYKGLAFFTKSDEPLVLPSDAEIITAKKIWIPS